MKRSNAFIPATETGKDSKDGQGQSITWVNKGGRNATTNEAKRGAGQVAPRPQNSKQPLLGSSAHTAGTQASMARVANPGRSRPEGRFLPVQKPPAGLQGSTIGQPDPLGFNPGGPGISIGAKSKMPVTNHPVATKKPNKRFDAFYGS